MLEQAYGWLLRSGIQEAGGGVARYYRADLQKNARISSEITGYVVSALVHLRHLACACDADRGRAAATHAARFLTREAWSERDSTIPFEPGSAHAYFFDIGIVVRGLLAAWRLTEEDEFGDRASAAALSLAFDFLGDGAFHPVITMPEKQPLDYAAASWSRSPGCYQLKSALAWKDLPNGSGQSRLFDDAVGMALNTQERFLPGHGEPEKVMDRLHAYCYFLEALLAGGVAKTNQLVLERGIARAGGLLREIAPVFERSDVCAQLLRVRLIGHHAYGLRLDETAAAEEATQAASYQAQSDDPRINGGFWFGRKGGAMLPHMNPVSTVFCMQALALWRDHREGRWKFDLQDLI